jgi:putative intracellular protease/amidase
MIFEAAAGALALGVGAYAFAPSALRAAGLHPAYRGPVYRMPRGSRALIVTTSHATLGDTGRKAGVFSSELTAPYYAFEDAGMTVDVASIDGGRVPFDPASFAWPVMALSDKRARWDGAFQAKVAQSRAVWTLDFTAYDIVFLAGGWGAAYDLGSSAPLGEGLTRAWAAGRVVGGVCHGPLGLLLARDERGRSLVEGRRLTAVTDRQVQQLRITATPLHPERELRAAGALFESRTRRLEILADHVVADGRLVTGQNQNAGEGCAQLMMAVAGGLPTGA